MKKQSGFSLVSVMVASALVGGLALGVMHITNNVSQGQSSAQALQDETELINEVRMILENERFCRVSLAGEGPHGFPTRPVIFKKSQIDSNKGLPFELFLSDQEGEKRTMLKFSAKDPTYSTHGKVTIKSIELKMTNGKGFDYEKSLSHSDMGDIVLVLERQVTQKTTRHKEYRFPVMLGMSTNATGSTTILDCKGFAPQGQTSDQMFYLCPAGTGGWNPAGSWRYYGCTGQITTQSTCRNIHHPNSQNRPCTPIGKIIVKP